MASNIYFGGEDAFTQQLIPGLPEEVTKQLFSFLFRPFQLNYLNRAPGGSYYATSNTAHPPTFLAAALPMRINTLVVEGEE